MRKSRFSDEAIIGILKEHQAGRSAAELCRKHGISDRIRPRTGLTYKRGHNGGRVTSLRASASPGVPMS